MILLTRPTYLAATILCAYSLKRVKSKYSLHVLVTPTLPDSSVQALMNAGCSIIKVDPLRPGVEVSVVAARFSDTWDKLRAFGLEGFDVIMDAPSIDIYDMLIFWPLVKLVVMLDADMLILQNMDELLELDLPEDCIAANHACTCNWSRDKWALEDW